MIQNRSNAVVIKNKILLKKEQNVNTPQNVLHCKISISDIGISSNILMFFR